MHTEVSGADLTEAFRIYQDGESARKVAEQLGIRADTFIRKLHAAGIPVRPRGGIQKLRSTRAAAAFPVEYSDAIRRYEKGESAFSLAREYGIGYGRFRSLMAAAGIPRPMDRGKSVEERFLAMMPRGEPGECWLWAGGGNQYGYGIIRRPDTLVHRMAYALFVGEIPEGMTVDHACHVPEECPGGDDDLHRRCCNPTHLIIAGRGPNALRGHSPSGENSRKTYCEHGHEFTQENTYVAPNGHRQCRTCRRERDRRRGSGWARQRQAIRADAKAALCPSRCPGCSRGRRPGRPAPGAGPLRTSTGTPCPGAWRGASRACRGCGLAWSRCLRKRESPAGSQGAKVCGNANSPGRIGWGCCGAKVRG